MTHVIIYNIQMEGTAMAHQTLLPRIWLFLFFNFMGMLPLYGAEPTPQPSEEQIPHYSDARLRLSNWFKLGLKRTVLCMINDAPPTNSTPTPANFDLSKIPPEFQIFFNKNTPKVISTDAYLDRMLIYLECSYACYVLALIYIERLINKTQKPNIFHKFSFHRLFFTAVVVAIKYYDDKFYSNEVYARIGGINTKELDKLEVIFLAAINCELFVPLQEWNAVIDTIKIPGDMSLQEWNATIKILKI